LFDKKIGMIDVEVLGGNGRYRDLAGSCPLKKHPRATQ
jgi:hypothetical protein